MEKKERGFGWNQLSGEAKFLFFLSVGVMTALVCGMACQATEILAR